MMYVDRYFIARKEIIWLQCGVTAFEPKKKVVCSKLVTVRPTLIQLD
jgi:flagellar assembly factor FliW